MLHLGNVVAFAAAWLSVRSQQGTVILRMEDVDPSRSRAEIADQQRRDLEWLGLTWDLEPPAQSQRDYTPWLDVVTAHTYRCTCSRKQIQASGGVYMGTCRDAGHTEGSLRFKLPEGPLTFEDRRWGVMTYEPAHLGDPVLRRRDGIFAYPLAVVADDLTDGVTEVVRGSDLLAHTVVQILLWQALAGHVPSFLHTPMVLGPDGTKLAKRHASTSVRDLKVMGWEPQDVWRAVLPWLGLSGVDNLPDAIGDFRPKGGPLGPIQLLHVGGKGSLSWHETPDS
jgi:glutamyl/glutaminyl-tRNA synthetase